MDKDFVMKNIESVTKPWGSFDRYTLNEASTIKIIRVKKGEATSLQSHQLRSEFWKILKGDARLTIEDKEYLAKPGEEFFIPPKIVHRLGAGALDVEILEIAFGHFDEEDISRMEDKYGRVSYPNSNKNG